MIRISLLALAVVTNGAFAQTLTPAEIEAMVDERVNSLNPYAELLNDPDPLRSLAALQIMMESGDPTLTRMALEFGLISTDPVVRRTALEAFLATGPVLSIRFEGEALNDPDRSLQRIGGTSYWSGAMGPDRDAFWRVAVGGYSDEERCFMEIQGRNCLITVNADGVFFTPTYMSGRAALLDTGILSGTANVSTVGEPVPFTVRLLD